MDAADDFTRAQRRHELDRLGSLLRHKPGESSPLRFDEVVSALGSRGEFDLGLRTIRLDTVIPPVEVYRGGGLHFVKDGHHRVSVAIAHRPGDDRRGRDRGADPAARHRPSRHSHLIWT